ncbi:hypothetical protein ILYODFUR_006052 [Ilyodon furcidens]|uniref:Uncharacterized protein n=1 Tax=Ilyodon furcidens TaxID=33524 RepID=A0ABV0TJ93_9TELE
MSLCLFVKECTTNREHMYFQEGISSLKRQDRVMLVSRTPDGLHYTPLNKKSLKRISVRELLRENRTD